MEQSYLQPILDLAALLDLDIGQVEPQLQVLEQFSGDETVGRIIANKIDCFAGRALERGHHDVADFLGHWHEQQFAVAA